MFKSPSHFVVASFIFAALLAGLIRPASADQVLLSDGSTLVGEIQQMTAEGLTIKTTFAGDLTLKREQIAGITSDKPMTVSLEGGERAVGKLTHDASGQKVTGTSFGDVSVQPSAVKAIWPAGAAPPNKGESAEAAAVRTDLEAKHKASMQAVEESLQKHKPKWGAKLEFGFSGQTGNSEIISFNGKGEIRRETSYDRMKIYLRGRYEKNNGARSANEILGGFDYEHDLSDRFFVWGGLMLEFDEFEDLDLRANVDVGVGYFFIREDDQELKGRLGVGYRHETFADGSSNDTGTLVATVSYMKEIAPWLLLTHETTFRPGFDNFSDFQIDSETAGEIPLDSDKRWKVKAGIRFEYDNEPLAGIDDLDTFYFVNIVYDFLK